jgi:hypothetical protein
VSGTSTIGCSKMWEGVTERGLRLVVVVVEMGSHLVVVVVEITPMAVLKLVVSM